MYKAYVDGYPLYDPANGFNLTDPKVSVELNKTGTFDFTIYPDHPYFGKLRKMTSIITVYDETQIVFRGRILNDEEGFHGERDVSCEGELAFLLDSIVRPYDYTGGIVSLFEKYVEDHNAQVEEAKRFKVGRVTVTDPNDYVHYSSTVYPNTWNEIGDKLIDTHGGYLMARHESDGTYLDYLADSDLMSAQPVEFGRNLLDFSRTTRGEDLATAVIPLGKKGESTTDENGEQIEGKRLTIADVNDGIDYVQDDEAVRQYGFILTTQTWDDVTEPDNLKRKGEEYLAQVANLEVELELTAVDLASLDADFGSFHLGTYVHVSSDPHGIDRSFLVSKLDINLSNPTSNKLTLGTTYLSFTEQTSGTTSSIENIQSQVNNVVIDVTNQVSSSVSQSSEYILQTVAENYYLKDDGDALVSSVNTRFEQTKDDFTFSFNELAKDLQDVAAGADAKFTDITKYIRFVDGDIVLGEEGNQLTLRIQNDRISFLEGRLEVAYFSGNKLYVKDGEYLNSLTLGRFAFLPRANGNLSFRKVVN